MRSCRLVELEEAMICTLATTLTPIEKWFWPGWPLLVGMRVGVLSSQPRCGIPGTCTTSATSYPDKVLWSESPLSSWLA